MEWGHDKNEKQPTRAREVCTREIQCVLRSSFHCVSPNLGVVPLCSVDHRFKRLDSRSRSARALVFATPYAVISSNVSHVSRGGTWWVEARPRFLCRIPFRQRSKTT